MSVADKAPNHISAHASQPNHSELHCFFVFHNRIRLNFSFIANFGTWFLRPWRASVIDAPIQELGGGLRGTRLTIRARLFHHSRASESYYFRESLRMCVPSGDTGVFPHFCAFFALD